MERPRKLSFGSQDQFEVQTKMPSANHSNKKDYSPLTWDQYFDQLCFLSNGASTYRAGQQGALYFCIHGAGHSSMSFALLAKFIRKFGTLVAYDLKGHGASKYTQNIHDLSIETLCSESIEVLKQVMQKYPDKNVILIGHSLGGSIAIRIADILTNQDHNQRISGLVVIDVVEGTAIEALPFMTQILQERPQHFDKIENAIKWSVTSGTLKKIQSARVSIPPQLLQIQKQGIKQYIWKIDLKDTDKYWLGWFKGLSSIFLKIKIAKILITAERQRLDKELMIAQMQGKFKLIILHHAGHSVQQDNYIDTAKTIYQFMKDFRIPMTLSEVSQKNLVGIANFHPNLNPF